MSITIPDLRFEQTFLRSLNTYAGDTKHAEPEGENLMKKTKRSKNGKLNFDVDAAAMVPSEPTPLVTPSIVAYAVIKDQIIMPLLQGFLWAGILVVISPLRSHIVAGGQSCGKWLFNAVGLGNLRPIQTLKDANVI
ncbi:hypothetical protein CAAN1_13S03136 [[Candida] anglica]|uniref:Uncharacterized protein n=1 Tax=[Candida] anglica TaxID=148631 RepID=A0ABP0EG92_9ASCO